MAPAVLSTLIPFSSITRIDNDTEIKRSSEAEAATSPTNSNSPTTAGRNMHID